VAPKIGGPWLKPFWPNGKSAPGSRLALVSMDWIRIGYPAGYLRFLDQELNWGICFWKKLDQDRIKIFVWFL